MAARELPGQIRVDVDGDGVTFLALAEQVNETHHEDDDLSSLISQLDAMIEAKEEAFRQVELQYKKLGESLRRMRQMRRLAVPEPRNLEPQKQPEKKKEQSTWTPSEKLKAAVLSVLDDEPKIIKQIAEASGVNPKTITTVLRVLRDEGKIRMVGMRKHRQGSPSPEYVITPNGRT